MKKMGIEYAGQQAKKGQYKGGNDYKPASYYFDNTHPIQSHKLKAKLVRDGLKKDECELCGISTWRGIKIPLELHHKNNNHLDNSFENLAILCPNCHSIQEGNSGANAGKYTAE
jgi:5-methylcytosine-specific restriction endonuclease McrA